MTPVTHALMNARPREVSGPWTSARYDFQKHVSILLMLELQQSGEDYRIAFDHYDDIVVLNHSDQPTRLRTYQVKSVEDGSWKIEQITGKTSRQPPRSIIAKMFDNIDRLGDLVESMHFATNGVFRFPLADGRNSGIDDLHISFEQISPAAQATINAAINNDYPPPRDAIDGRLEFRRFGLAVQDQGRSIKGALMDFFDGLGGSDGVPVKAVYDALFTEVARKSHPCTPRTTDELYAAKTIARGMVTSLVDEAMTGRRLCEMWGDINAELTAAGVPSVQRIELKSHCVTYVGDRAAGKPQAIRFARIVSEAVDANHLALSRLVTIIERVNLLDAQLPSGPKGQYSGLQRRAGLIVHALEDVYAGIKEHHGAEEAPEQLEGAK